MTRRLRIRQEGLALYQRWAQTLRRAQEAGEQVPQPHEYDAVVAWLDGRGEIEPPIDTEQARVLVELVYAGNERGERSFLGDGR